MISVKKTALGAITMVLMGGLDGHGPDARA